MLCKPGEFKNTSFAFYCARKLLENNAFWKRWCHDNVAFLNSSGVVWTKQLGVSNGPIQFKCSQNFAFARIARKN